MKKTVAGLLLCLTITPTVSAQTIVNITTDHIQLTYRVKPDGRIYQTYLGEKLDPGTPLGILDMPRVKTTSSNIRGHEAYPVMGTEDYYEAALEITHADGNPTSVLTYQSHETHPRKDATETIVRLADKRYPLNVDMHFIAYPAEDIIEQYAVIRHGERGNVYLGRYASSMIYFEAPAYYLTEFSSDWAKEMQMTHSQLTRGKKVLDTRLGSRAAMLMPPFFEIGLGRPAEEETGTVLMGTLAWTGNTRFTLEIDHNNALRIISGINPDASRYLLPQNKEFVTPAFLFTLSTAGTGQGSRNFQRWAINHRLYKGKQDRRTLLNNWENTFMNFDEPKLISLFGEARDLGVDLFLLDDGWFGNKYPRKEDNAGLGDWQVTREKLPHGLPYLVDRANETGVDFGLWVEPEMVNPRSELAEKHPDWILRLPGRETYYFRNQLVLDLSNPAVQDFVFTTIDQIVSQHPRLHYLKWDCNSPITNIYSVYQGRHQGNLYIDYVRGLYSVLDRIQTKYPDLDMMMCSGGGGRCDFGGLAYFTEFWPSDNTDPVERLYIQWGYSHFMPAKAVCAHVTNWNRAASVKFRVDVAFAGKLGFDIDLKTLRPDEMAYCREAVRVYNRLKPVLFSPEAYRLVSPYETDHCVFQRNAEDGSKVIVMAYDINPRISSPLLPVKLRGLDPKASYRVSEILTMDGRRSETQPESRVLTGDYLMRIGLPILTTDRMASRIIEIDRL